MRDIEFRGKREDNKEWVYGYYTDFPGSGPTIETIQNDYRVIPETVGQYTGLSDKKLNKVYEGDVFGGDGYWKFYVGFNDGGFVMIPCNAVQRANWKWFKLGSDTGDNIFDRKVIGNIHDNPELLEE